MSFLRFLSLFGAFVATQTVFGAEPSPFDLDLTPDTSALVTPGTPNANPNAPSQSPFSSAIQNLNPDISFLGDFVGGNQAALTPPGDAPHAPINLREIEVDAAGYISPYAKGFFVVSVSPTEGADVEEAYMNFFTLPLNTSLKIGKMRADIDTLNPLHRHSYPFIDQPLVLQRLLGDEGFKAVGANVSTLIPNPWNHFVMLSGTMSVNPYYEDTYTAFYGGTQQTMMYSLKASTSFDFSSITYLTMNAGAVEAPLLNKVWSRLFLADALLRIVPNAVSNSFTFLTGYYWNKQDPQQTGAPFLAQGLYGFAGWQFSPRWKIGYRYDHVDDPNPVFGGVEQQHNAMVTFYPTETNYLRLQVGRHQLPGSINGGAWEDLISAQVNFAMGPHQLHMNL